MALISRNATNYTIVGCLLLSISIAAVALRVVARRRRGQTFRLHEYLVFLSLLGLVGYVACVVAAFALGVSAPIATVSALPVTRIKTAFKIFLAAQFFSAISVTASRLAIILLYMEIFEIRVFQWLAKVTALIVILYGIIAILMSCLLCRPISIAWDPTIQGECGDIMASVIFSASFNMFIDIWTVFLPLPIIWKLQMTKQRKWGITSSFAVGLLTAVSNLSRLITISTCPKDSPLPLCALETSIQLTAEMTGGIAAACVPTFGTIFFKKNRQNSSNTAHPGTPATIGSGPIKPRRSIDTTSDESHFSYDVDESQVDV